MSFTFEQERDEGVAIVATSRTGLHDGLMARSRKAGCPLVSTSNFDDDGNIESLVISSVAGLSFGDLLDERHVTQYEVDVETRSEINAVEEEEFERPFAPSPDREDFELFEIIIPSYEDVVEALHSNNDAVSAPIENSADRRRVVQHYQQRIVNMDVLNSQSLYGDFYDGDEKTYDNLYANLTEHNREWADNVVSHSDTIDIQFDAAAAELDDGWMELFTIPYSFYKRALFNAYYASRYGFAKQTYDFYRWSQTELYKSVPSLSQCRRCARVCSEEKLDDTQLCADQECSSL